MQDWNDIEDEAALRRQEEELGARWQSRRSVVVSHTDKNGDNDKNKAEAEFERWASDQRQKNSEELKSRVERIESAVGGNRGEGMTFEQPPPLELGGWNSAGVGSANHHPSNDATFEIELGVDDGREIMSIDDGVLGGGDEGEALPRGIADYQVLVWNHTDKKWEPVELKLEINGASIELKAVGTTISGDSVITSVAVPECA